MLALVGREHREGERDHVRQGSPLPLVRRPGYWKHLRTSNVIESPFATVRLRQRVTKGAGSRTKGLLMAYKLLGLAQARWRRLDGAHLLPLLRAGISHLGRA